jgi:hypothetical protein
MKPEDWAKMARGIDGLNGAHTLSPKLDPRLVAQITTSSVFLSHGPAEYFSNLKPKRIGQSNPDELTIDDLYGSYDAKRQTIEIYRQQIARDSDSIDCSAEQLTCIVRLHEYAHALAHVGVPFESVEKILSETGSDSRTNWKEILRTQKRRFLATPQEAGELLAQAITWAALGEERGLQLAFEALEQRQPSQYRLSDRIKTAASRADWPMVLRAARGEVVSLPLRRNRREALEELICLAA